MRIEEKPELLPLPLDRDEMGLLLAFIDGHNRALGNHDDLVMSATNKCDYLFSTTVRSA